MQGQRARRGREGRSHGTGTTAALVTASEQEVVVLLVGTSREQGFFTGEAGVELVGGDC